MIRKVLSSSGLFCLISQCFKKIEEHRRESNIIYPLKDVLSAGLALFSFKYRSLDKFLKELNDKQIGQNIKNLFKIGKIPGDTQFRDILDPLPPEELRGAYDAILRELQRGKKLQEFTVLGELYPISLDGTGYFSSSNSKCPSCLKKKIKKGSDDFIYHHQMLGAAITHPDYKQVIPLFPEPINNTDGESKNDCERNASKRWIKNFRRHHPKMPVIIIEDSLASNAPHIEVLQKYNCRYLLGTKEKDHKYLYEQFSINSKNNLTQVINEISYTGEKVKKKITRQYEFINDLELNLSNTHIKTNLIIFKEKIEYLDPPKGKKNIISEKKFSWITDIKLTTKNAARIVQIGRRRWAIENETFQTLKKTTEYNIEHNYGHGKQFLVTNFAILCILAFLIDQVQELVSGTFKEVLSIVKVKNRMWELMRSAITWLHISDWENYFGVLAKRMLQNTS